MAGMSGIGGAAAKLPAGAVLGLVDICAARSAAKHAFGGWSMDKARNQTVVTVAMDRMSFTQPIGVGDQVDVVGHVVRAGSSSLAVQVEVNRIQFPSKAMQKAATAVVFMVAVDKNLRPAKVVPPLLFEKDPSLQAKASCVARAQAGQREDAATCARLNAATWVSPDERTDAANDAKTSHVTIPSTEHLAHRLFFPGTLNLNDTVFGGELLRWMESHATHCGRVFSGHRHVYAVGMNSVVFKEPVYKTDWTELKAHVVFVRHSTMQIDVEVTAERDGKKVPTNEASFVVVSLDEIGKPLPVLTGLRVGDGPEDLPSAKRFARAKARYYASRRAFSKAAAGEATPPPPPPPPA